MMIGDEEVSIRRMTEDEFESFGRKMFRDNRILASNLFELLKLVDSLGWFIVKYPYYSDGSLYSRREDVEGDTYIIKRYEHNNYISLYIESKHKLNVHVYEGKCKFHIYDGQENYHICYIDMYRLIDFDESLKKLRRYVEHNVTDKIEEMKFIIDSSLEVSYEE